MPKYLDHAAYRNTQIKQQTTVAEIYVSSCKGVTAQPQCIWQLLFQLIAILGEIKVKEKDRVWESKGKMDREADACLLQDTTGPFAKQGLQFCAFNPVPSVINANTGVSLGFSTLSPVELLLYINDEDA